MSHDAQVVLSITGLGCEFGAGPVLEDVDLEVNRGEIVGLIGPGGAGKSVLVKTCCGLLPVRHGRVAVLGHDLSGLSGRERQRLRERIGLVFQNYALFDFMTVADNVAFPMRQRGDCDEATIAARVAERLAEVDLPRAGDLMPAELSGGMKKRVGVARAGIHDPELMFFDDPTAGLDPVTSSKIFNLIRRVQRDHHTTCLVVSHDIDRLRATCDRYVLLYDGRVRWQGDNDDADRTDDAIVRAFFSAGAGMLR